MHSSVNGNTVYLCTFFAASKILFWTKSFLFRIGKYIFLICCTLIEVQYLFAIYRGPLALSRKHHEEVGLIYFPRKKWIRFTLWNPDEINHTNGCKRSVAYSQRRYQQLENTYIHTKSFNLNMMYSFKDVSKKKLWK
jgi:hypothetical protein